MDPQAQILPGTLDLLILKAVSLGRLHGYIDQLVIRRKYPNKNMRQKMENHETEYRKCRGPNRSD